MKRENFDSDASFLEAQRRRLREERRQRLLDAAAQRKPTPKERDIARRHKAMYRRAKEIMYARTHYYANRTHRLAQRASYYRAHVEQELARIREWRLRRGNALERERRLRDPELYAALKRASFQKWRSVPGNREKDNAKRAAYYQANKEKERARVKAYRDRMKASRDDKGKSA